MLRSLGIRCIFLETSDLPAFRVQISAQNEIGVLHADGCALSLLNPGIRIRLYSILHGISRTPDEPCEERYNERRKDQHGDVRTKHPSVALCCGLYEGFNSRSCTHSHYRVHNRRLTACVPFSLALSPFFLNKIIQ